MLHHYEVIKFANQPSALLISASLHSMEFEGAKYLARSTGTATLCMGRPSECSMPRAEMNLCTCIRERIVHSGIDGGSEADSAEASEGRVDP
jgi:hypothetical protein